MVNSEEAKLNSQIINKKKLKYAPKNKNGTTL